jgi:hypothetical protein
MNPPVNRENLRDALIALVVATGLAWVVRGFRGGVWAKSPSITIHYRVPARVP